MTMEWHGGELVARVNAETIKALAVAAEMVLAKSQEQCPVETDAMRSSATVKPLNGGKTQELSYGGASAAYVHRQHEDLTYNHPVGNAKFLENPLRENADKVLKYLNDATARGLKGG